MTTPLRPTRRLILAAPLLAAPGLARAATWPERPVEVIVPFTPGGGVDLTGRIAARFLDKHTGGRGFVVVNRPGAGGEIGWGQLAEARPDGHTMAVLNVPNVLAIPIERANARFRLSSFTLIANLADDPITLSVHASSPIRSVAALLAAGRARPGGLTYGTAGVGAAGHVAMMQFARATGFQGEHVPFAGASNVSAALLGRQIDLATTTFAESASFASGSPDWRVLGVMAPERLPARPDLPTLAEMGIPIEAGSLRGLAVPRGTPPDTVAAITAAVERMVADPEWPVAMAAASLPLRVMRADAYAAHLARVDTELRSLWTTNPWR